MRGKFIPIVSAAIALLAGATFALTNPTCADAADRYSGTISNVSVAETELEQGESTSVDVTFDISSTMPGQPLLPNDTYSFETNIGDIFEISSGNDAIPIEDDSGTTIASVAFTNDAMVVTFSDAVDGSTTLHGQVTSASMTVKDLGATADASISKDLQVGDAKVTLTISNPDDGSDEPGEPKPSDPASPDFNVLWKNAWGNSNKTGAGVTIEVNPQGTIDMYLEANGTGLATTQFYEDFTVKDTIPGGGIIDESSLTICAAVPSVGTSSGPEQNPYGYAEGTLYAVRQGTQRFPLDGSWGDKYPTVIERLYQNDGETLDEFETRVKSEQLQWGIYVDDEGTQTLLCNFGNLGPDDMFEDGNNGVMYENYVPTWCKRYPQIFGDEAPSEGNSLSYYIEFNTYYPDAVGTQKYHNYASWEALNVVKNQQQGWGNNSAEYTISAVDGIGYVRSTDVAIKLVDEDDRGVVIPDADFKLQMEVDGEWVDTGLTATTDENGRLTFPSLVPGEYRIVQETSQDGYIFDNDTYGPNYDSNGDVYGGTLTVNGEFDVDGTETIGHASIVTNRKVYRATYRFESADESMELPQEVLDLLPTDDTHYLNGDYVFAKQPSSTEVVTSDGVWTFVEYDSDETQVHSADVEFVGYWDFEKVDKPIADDGGENGNNGEETGDNSGETGDNGEETGDNGGNSTTDSDDGNSDRPHGSGYLTSEPVQPTESMNEPSSADSGNVDDTKDIMHTGGDAHSAMLVISIIACAAVFVPIAIRKLRD